MQRASGRHSALLQHRCIEVPSNIYCEHVERAYGNGYVAMDLSLYEPSFRIKRLAWGGYGFGHTSRREPGDLRGTVVGRKGRFRVS